MDLTRPGGNILGCGKLLFLCVATALTLAACATTKKRVAKVQPPPKPLLPQVLPLRSPEPLLRSPYARWLDPVDLLIGQAEDLYAAGKDDYRSGNLDKAKEEFDQAVSLLLESKLDLDRERINSEIDKLLEDIQSLELPSLETGDTSPLHKYVPAPIESFTGLTFPVDPNVKQRVQQEVQSVRSDLPLVSNDYVAGVINFFQYQARGQEFMQKIIQRSGLYQPIIAEALRKEGLPQDLIYVAGAESAFNPLALSHAGAKGIWQFMLSRGAQYGLKKDRWVDEREDPSKSTLAAVRHLKELYQMFGDWYLALAAYDSGPITIQKAVEKTGYADFWMLRQLRALPKETENYVPIFLATAFIAKNPAAFGFGIQPAAALTPDQVTVSLPTDLRLIAQLIDRPVEELIQWNPSLLRWTTPANNPHFLLNLPPGTRETYERAIASIPPDRRIWWRAHKVEAGETLASIAKKYRISKVALAQVNQIRADARLEEGAHLVLPMAPGRESSLARVRERGPLRSVHYRVRPGDTLELIADRFDVTPYQIRSWNGMKTSGLVAGKTLRLYVRGAAGGGHTRHRARHRASSQSSRVRSTSPPPSPSQARADTRNPTPSPLASR